MSGQILLPDQAVTAIQGGRELKAYWQQIQGVFQDPFAALSQFYTIRRMLTGP